MDFPPLPAIPSQHRTIPAVQPSLLERDPPSGLFPNELGIPVAVPDLRIVTDEVCVALDTFSVYAEGVHAQLRIIQRDPKTGNPEHQHTWYLSNKWGVQPDTELWRMGLEFADGRKAWTPNLVEPAWENDFGLTIFGGGGDASFEVHRVYVSPVPPVGLLHLHVDLGTHGRHSVSADCSDLVDAAQMHRPIWESR